MLIKEEEDIMIISVGLFNETREVYVVLITDVFLFKG